MMMMMMMILMMTMMYVESHPRVHHGRLVQDMCLDPPEPPNCQVFHHHWLWIKMMSRRVNKYQAHIFNVGLANYMMTIVTLCHLLHFQRKSNPSGGDEKSEEFSQMVQVVISLFQFFLGCKIFNVSLQIKFLSLISIHCLTSYIHRISFSWWRTLLRRNRQMIVRKGYQKEKHVNILTTTTCCC